MADPTVAEPWVAGPLTRLRDDARLISGVLLYPSGRAVGQFGFSNAADVMSIFNRESSLGVVEIYFAEFQKALERLQPEKEAAGEGPSGDFEGELNRSLDALFGPIGKH